MNKRNLILASAVAMAFSAMAAQAATFTTTTTTHATEIFGTGSNDTLIKLPPSVYTVGATAVPVGATDTYKFTLSNGAVFGAAVTGANLTGGAGVWSVVSGGAIGDNTVIFKSTLIQIAGGVLTLSPAAGEIQVKNLQASLSTAGGIVEWAAEVAGYTDLVTSTDPTPNVLTSAAGVTFTTDMTTTTKRGAITATGGTGKYHSINVADTSKKFSAVGSTSFDTTTSVTHLSDADRNGELVLAVTAGVKNEAGTAFGFSSGDTVAVTLAGNFPSFQTGNGVYLKKGATCSLADTPTVGGTTLAAATKSASLFTFNIPAADLPAPGGSTKYSVCLTTNTTTEIAETTITPAAAINYFNARYIDANKASSDVDGLKRNGVTQTVPYMLSGTNSYTTYLRVVNTGTINGRINVTCYKDDGSSANGILATSLAPKAAVIKTPAEVATACGAGGATTNANYSYVRVIGETNGMDAIQFMFNPNGTVTQFSTNNNQNN